MRQLIIILALVTNASFAFTQAQKLDTVLSVRWFNGAWQNSSRTINNYDEDCRLKTVLVQNWNVITGKWADFSNKQYSYTNEHYIVEIMTQLWLDDSWTNSYRQIYSYYPSWQIQSVTDQNWLTDHWSNYRLVSNTYDSNGYIDSVLTQSSDNDEPFTNYAIDVYSYNNDGSLRETVNQFWNNVSKIWVNYIKESFTYNSNKTIHSSTEAFWNYSSALWQPGTQTLYTYTVAGKLYNYTIQGWQANQWVNQWLYSAYFDTNGFPSGVLIERWDGFDWEKFRQNSDKNNSDGTIRQHTAQYWVETLNNWVNDLQDTYTYSASCLLPLQLLSFTAAQYGAEVKIRWATTDEINMKAFNIQRSFNGKDFNSIGHITPRSATGVNTYDYVDAIDNIGVAKIYYRLQAVNQDQSYTFSRIVPLTITSNKETLKVYPNPAKNIITISFSSPGNRKAKIQINDMRGNTVYRHALNATEQNNTVFADISSLSKGTYHLLLITGTDIQQTMFIKP